MRSQDEHQPLNPNKIKKIFTKEHKDPKWYLESSDLFLEDQKWLWEYFKDSKEISGEKLSQKQKKGQQGKVRSKVKGLKGRMVGSVTYDGDTDILSIKKKSSNEEIAFKLAERLDDLRSLPYYEKLVAERRCDFLRNCLVITLNAYSRGVVTKNKASYFTGVVKNKTATLERLKKYKQKHTT